MLTRPLFTIVTITYNSSAWVRQAIESVLSSSYGDFEYIISDDCSSDDTWEIVKSYKDPRIKAWQNEQNLGEYPNRNKVLEQALGQFILFIDGDDILYRDSLEEYSRYIEAFPSAGGVWGVFTIYFDFVVFPYLLPPEELTRLNFLSLYPVTVVGLAETLFNTECLRKIGGFNTGFGIGDTYVKRRMACEFPMLLIPAGRCFWRQSANQASQLVRKKYRILIETFRIDREILSAPYCPLEGVEKELAVRNFRIRTIKLVVGNTLMKGRFTDFFMLMKKMEIPYTRLAYLFKKADYSYKARVESDRPLFNDYNFRKKP